MKERIITAIDLGTTKFFGLTGLVRETGIEVIGKEVIQTGEEWIKGGRVGDIEGVASGLIDITESLKRQSGEKIEWINVGIGGKHIVGKVYSQKIEILPKGRPINENDIQLMIKEIKNLAMAENGSKKELVHLIPQEYIIDENDATIIGKPPIGMHGNTLLMKAHVLTGELNPLNDIYECAKMAGLKIEKVFPYSWAVAESVLKEEEKKSGCVVIDIGKSTTDFVFFHDGKIIWTESLKVGSFHIDYDLSLKFHVSLDFAEELKKNYAWCDYKKLTEKGEIKTIEIKNPYGKSLGKVSIEEISKIVYLRVCEIFEDLIIKERLLKTGLFPLKTCEVVLSGGGAKLKGIVKLAEDIFNLPVRIGLPQKLPGLEKNFQKPEFSAGIGLLLLASKETKERQETLLGKIKKFFNRWFY